MFPIRLTHRSVSIIFFFINIDERDQLTVDSATTGQVVLSYIKKPLKLQKTSQQAAFFFDFRLPSLSNGL